MQVVGHTLFEATAPLPPASPRSPGNFLFLVISEAELVKLRYFVGRTNKEAEEAPGISPCIAKHYWTHACAWLFREMEFAQRR